MKECGNDNDADKNSNNTTAVTTDEAGKQYALSTEDMFLLDNLWVENCEEVLKEKRGNLNDVLKRLTDVYDNIVLETYRVDSGDENYDYDNSELSDGDVYSITKPFPSSSNVEALAYTGTAANHTIIGNGVVPQNKEDEVLALLPNLKRACPGGSSSSMVLPVVTNTRLMKDLSLIMKTDTTLLGFSIDPVNDCDISLWNIHLFNFEDCDLAIDMKKMETERGIKTIDVELKFPTDYPYSPPQARIIQPRFKPGTGFIVKGGFCIDLLTKEVCC